MNKRIRELFIIKFFVIALIVAGTVFVPADAFAASWHDVYLKDGQTYDVSEASSNTTVHIDETGTFTLKGKSTKVRVSVKSKDAVIYLADGLNINAGILSNVGQRTAAITLTDNGGRVELISKAGAKITLNGYLGTPAIEKEGTSTKLIFNTENKKNPGTITATSELFSDSPGIGSSGKGITARNVWTGNMEFNGGIIIAEGAGSAAGIGGCAVGHVDGILVDGAEIVATGGNQGAGIGGGYRGNAINIHIKSGSIRAYAGENGAGIGTGASDTSSGFRPYAKNIVVDGGTVYAEGNSSGSGLGGGKEGSAERIYINNGSVIAIGGTVNGNGIGGGGGNHYGTGTDIRISGGFVRAEAGSDATAIGSSSSGGSRTDIYISGGEITAIGGDVGIGGGGPDGYKEAEGQTYVTISGGTVKVQNAGVVDIGSDRNSEAYTIITGGSVNAAQNKVDEPVNGNGDDVFKTVIRLEGVKGNKAVTAADIADENLNLLEYGLNDVWTDIDKLYFWIPEKNNVLEVAVNDMNDPVYEGSVLSGGSGTLTLKANEPEEYIVSFDGNTPENTAGTVVGEMSEQAFTEGEAQALTACSYKLRGYAFAGWNTEPDGTGAAYADKATITGLPEGTAGIMTLYAQWEPETYTISFKANNGTGTMDPQTMTYDQAAVLNSNSFTAPEGMVFAGWKRTGALGACLYEDGAEVINLCSYNPDTNALTGYTMEAQWSSSEKVTIICTKDDEPYQPGTIELLKDTNDYTYILTESSAAGTYSCALEGVTPGIYKIIVNGEDTGETVAIGENEKNSAFLDYYSVAVTIDEKYGTVSGSKDAVLSGSIVEIKAQCHQGYAFVKWISSGSEPSGWDPAEPETEITVTGKTEIRAEAEPVKCTVTFDANVPLTDSSVTGSMAPQIIEPDAPQDLNPNTYELTGYTFKGWNTKPDGTGTAYADRASVTVTQDAAAGGIVLYAQWDPNVYTISYDENAADSGNIDSQKCTYDEPVILAGNAFSKNGYHFVGWNTGLMGTGKAYAAGDEVINLTSERYGMIDLYPQWEKDIYVIEYEANGGSGYMPDEEVWTISDWNLAGCGFDRPGYDFVAWNTKADGSGKNYKAADPVTGLAANGETVRLYAQWKECRHSGGKADCVNKATCIKCGQLYGEPDGKNHIGVTEKRNAVAAEEFKDGYTGDIYCLGCNECLEKGEIIPAANQQGYGPEEETDENREAPAENETAEKADSPRTDDISHSFCWVLLMSGLMIMIAVTRKKYN